MLEELIPVADSLVFWGTPWDQLSEQQMGFMRFMVGSTTISHVGACWRTIFYSLTKTSLIKDGTYGSALLDVLQADILALEDILADNPGPIIWLFNPANGNNNFSFKTYLFCVIKNFR